MELRPLGSTGIRVSLLGLGTVKFGRNEGVKYPTAFNLPDDRHVTALLREARALGINLLDTAPAYGSSEERIGRLLPGSRDQWLIVSKAGEQFEAGESRFDFSPAAIRTSVEQSLRRLRTDYLDAVLLHSDGADEEGDRFLPAVETLDGMKREGKLRATGFSGKTLAGGLKMVNCVDLLMVTYNPGQREELPVIEAAVRLRKGILIKKALASGHAANPEQALAETAALPGVSGIVVGTLSADNLRRNAKAVARG